MEGKILAVLFALCAVFAVVRSEVKCYTCTRLEFTIFSDGDDSEKCEYPMKKEAKMEEGCKACAFDTRDEDFDWVGRYCIKDDSCKNGTFEQDTPGFTWVNKLPGIKENPDFDVERQCCTEDLCNGEPFDTDAAGASAVHVTCSLLVAAILSAFFYM